MKRLKLLCLLLALTLGFQTIYTQPQRIGNSNVYYELFFNGSDSTLKFTGTGILPYSSSLTTYYRTSVKHIEIGEGITTIGNIAFRDWIALEKVNLPNSLKKIESYAFNNDTALRTINLPKQLEIIECSAFLLTKCLPDTLSFPTLFPNLISFGKGRDYYSFGNTFYGTTIKHVVIPLKTDTIFSDFVQCKQLSSVILPATLKHFIKGTFYNDTALKLVVDLNPIPQTFEVPKGYNNAFDNVKRSQCRLIVPTSAVDLYKSTPIWQDFLIEGGGLSAGASVNAKEKGNIRGVEYRFYQKGEHITWKAEPVEGCTFSGWRSNGEWISTGQTLSFTITKDTMIEAVFDGEPLSVPISSEKHAMVSIYPNPAQNQFTVKSNSAINCIILYDLSGRKVLQTSNSCTVDVSGMAKGAYWVEIRTDEGRYMKKFIRQ